MDFQKIYERDRQRIAVNVDLVVSARSVAVNTYLNHGRNGRREDDGQSQTDWRQNYIFDMAILNYRDDVECLCNQDTMNPFQNSRVDTVSRWLECRVDLTHRTEAT